MATARLSKSWKHDWLTLPFLIFDERFYYRSSQLIRDRFHNLQSDCDLTPYTHFLTRILKRRAALQGRFSYSNCLQGLSFMLHFAKERPSLPADELLTYAISNFKIESLELIAHLCQTLFLTFFQSESLSHMNGHTLKSLSLHGIKLNQHTVEMLALGCPFLELFKLSYCYVSDPVIFEIRGLNKLTDLRLIQNEFPNAKLVMDLPRLESLYCAKTFLDIDIVSAPHLKNLTLKSRSLSDGLLERLLLCFQSLERLEFQHSCISGNLRIVNHSLKHFILKLNLVSLAEFYIDAPNLEHFIYYHMVTVEGGMMHLPLYMMDNFTLKKTTVDAKVSWKSIIWNRISCSKHMVIGWLSTWERLLTKDRLRRFGMSVGSECYLCNEGIETHKHLFFDCVYSAKCLELLSVWLDVRIPRNLWRKWWCQWKCHSLLRKKVTAASIVTLLYYIWMMRNRVRLTESVLRPHIIVQLVKKEIMVRMEHVIPKECQHKNRHWIELLK